MQSPKGVCVCVCVRERESERERLSGGTVKYFMRLWVCNVVGVTLYITVI
jgi:hypothetical protein